MIFGIIGGMGPAATCDLYQKIIELTPADSDQGHLHIIIDSAAQIPDRSAFLAGSGPDPRPALIESARRLEAAGAEILLIACNTAHAFYREIAGSVNAAVLNMPEEASAYAGRNYGSEKPFLLLATDGAYESGIYEAAFLGDGLEILEPNEKDKEKLMDWIYSVKAGNCTVKRGQFKALLSRYDAAAAILGCTELPVLTRLLGGFENTLDPTLILAKRAVELEMAARKASAVR